MIFFTKKKSVKSKKPFFNSLNSEGIKLFYKSKEVVHSYVIGEGVLKRREISLQIIEILNIFLKYKYSDEEINSISDIFEHNFDVLKKVNLNESDNDNTLINQLKSIDIKGYNLLRIQNKIDTSTLKKLYREASKKHHPDKGGSKKKMQKINEVFSLFHEMITNYIPVDEQNTEECYFSPTCKTWDEWLFSVHLVLACIYGDLFAADKSLYHLIQSEKYAKKSNNKYIGQYIGSFLESGRILGNTCSTLGRFNMKEELEQASKITSYFIDRFVVDWEKRYKDDEKPKRNNYNSKKEYSSWLGTRIVLKHIEQVKNAYRLNQIDEKRYSKSMKKFKKKSINEEKMFNTINNFIKEIGFITKVSNSSYKTNADNPKVVIAPDSFIDRFDFLEEEQKWEYLNVFSNKGTGKSFDKYYYVRTNEILLGLITSYDYIELEKLNKEINFFTDNFPDKYSNYFLLYDIVNYLRNEDDRNDKLQKLSEMDDPNIKTNSISIHVTIDFNNLFSDKDVVSHKPENGYKKRIQLDDDYIAFVKMNIKNILKYQETGEIKKEFVRARNKDLSLLHKLNNSTIGKNYEKILLHSKKTTSEMIIDNFEPYANELIKIGKKFNSKNTYELQIGYIINNITIAYGKLKEWDKLIYWGDLFFNLPRNYRDRSSQREQNSIRNRLEKAKAKINV